MEKAILVAVCTQNSYDFDENIEEMKNLAYACEIEVDDVITQNLPGINKKFYVNSGKIEEVRALALDKEIEILLFNASLSPSQLRNIENFTGCSVYDKSDLILQIFSKRAKSKEAKLQVECAQLKYTLPRLAGSYEHMDRQRGGDHNKGSGEKKIELDARRIEQRIQALERELKQIEIQRSVQRRLRNKNQVKSAALVGYTNAGKSSIMNGCMAYLKKEDKDVFEKDMLFATLTTSIRNITLESKNTFTLSDTVGFISDLPHTLVEAFKSTLEEAKESDLLIEVVDASTQEMDRHMKVCKETLEEIGCGDKEILYVFNKCDLANIHYPYVEENRIYICAKEEESITFLLKEIEKRLFTSTLTTLLIPYEKGSLLNLLNTKCNILSQEYKENGIEVHVYIPSELSYLMDQYHI